MKTLHGEPTDRHLDHIYMKEKSRPIVVDGLRGMITNRGGGWGNISIEVNFPMTLTTEEITIVKRERESDDYEGIKRDCDGGFQPNRIQTYNWQIEDEDKYYWSLSDALNGKSTDSAC